MKNIEYISMAKERLEQIKNDNKDIVDLVDLVKCDVSHKNLFMIFLANLKKFHVSDEIYKKVEKMLLDETNVQKSMKEHECVFGVSLADREICTFDQMMAVCFERNGPQFYESALRYAIVQSEKSKEKGNVIDNFLRYTVAHNYDEVEFGKWEDANFEDYYEGTLYGYPLGRMFLDVMQTNDGREFISPESLHIRKNLQGLMLGAFLLQKVMKDMDQEHPNEPLVSPTVMMSNINALKLYNSLGAKVYVDGQLVEDPINGMDHSIKRNCLVVFESEAIKKYASTVIDKPVRKINDIKAGTEHTGR